MDASDLLERLALLIAWHEERMAIAVERLSRARDGSASIRRSLVRHGETVATLRDVAALLRRLTR